MTQGCSRADDWSYKSRRGGLGLNEEPQTSAGERAAGSKRSGAPLRLVSSEPAITQTEIAAWARQAEHADWCLDAQTALAAGCSMADSGVAAMPASERRAVHLTRQRIRAQAILAAVEPAGERERIRRWAIVLGSVVLHAVGFVVFATAVADLEPRPRPVHHEHLFEARAVVPIELPEPVVVQAEQAEPTPSSVDSPPPKPSPARRSKPALDHDHHDHDHHDHATPSESAPYELRGFELSSQGELAAGEPGGKSHGQPGGTGAGRGQDGHSSKPAASPDEPARPRGGLLQPEYPPELERRGVEGSVLVKVWIDEHGHVIKAEVVESSHEEAFDHNALMAAQRQEWTPAIERGEPVASTRRYRVHFRLR